MGDKVRYLGKPCRRLGRDEFVGLAVRDVARLLDFERSAHIGPRGGRERVKGQKTPTVVP